MIKAVLDTSVLVSPFVTPKGSVAPLLYSPLRQRYELCVSRPLMTELAQTLLHKRSLRKWVSYDDATAEAYMRWLLKQASMIGEVPEIQAVERDPKDNMVVATAVAHRADYLVTGDRRHLLPIGEYAGTRIVSPREFLDILATQD